MFKKTINLALLLLIPAALVAMDETSAGQAHSVFKKRNENKITDPIALYFQAASIADLLQTLKEAQNDICMLEQKHKAAELLQIEEKEAEDFIIVRHLVELLTNVEVCDAAEIHAQAVQLKRRIRVLEAHERFALLMGLERVNTKECLNRFAASLRNIQAQEQSMEATQESQERALFNAEHSLRAITEIPKREHLRKIFDEREKAGYRKVQAEMANLAKSGVTPEIKEQAQQFYQTITQFIESKTGQFCFSTEQTKEQFRHAAEQECRREERAMNDREERSIRASVPIPESEPLKGYEDHEIISSESSKPPVKWWKVAAGTGIVIVLVWSLKKWYASAVDNERPAGK